MDDKTGGGGGCQWVGHVKEKKKNAARYGVVVVVRGGGWRAAYSGVRCSGVMVADNDNY